MMDCTFCTNHFMREINDESMPCCRVYGRGSYTSDVRDCLNFIQRGNEVFEDPKPSITDRFKRFKITLTRTLHPAMWEYGGNRGTMGYCQIVADNTGLPLVPLFIARNCNPNAQQALYQLRRGNFVIRTHYFDNGGEKTYMKTYIFRVADIDIDDRAALVEQVASCRNGEWDAQGISLIAKNPDIMKAVDASRSKVMEINCKRPFYFKTKN